MRFLYAALLILSVVYLVPDILMHRLKLWTIARNPAPSGGPRGLCALTFDDGPNAEFTPLILDSLRRHGCRATFFVLGKKAAELPDIVKRMAVEGHEIGIHGWDHRHPWLLGPLCRGQFERAAKVVESCAGGILPTMYRPPWGFWSLWNAIGSAGYARIMWSLPSDDWKRETTPESLTASVLSRIENGSIALLHDGAAYSWKTASALDAILDGIWENGLKAVTVAELFSRPIVP